MDGCYECEECYGLGIMHSFGRNGDPADDGVTCECCNGSGVVAKDFGARDMRDNSKKDIQS